MKLLKIKRRFLLVLLALLGACSGEPDLTLTLSADKTEGEAPLEVSFSADVPEGEGSVSYAWDFGTDAPGATAEGGSNRTYTFEQAGTFLVSAKATRNARTAAASTKVTVSSPQIGSENSAPKVSLSASPTEGAAPLTVSFKADASDPEGDMLTYTWDFGNGERADGNTSRTVTYREHGSYTAVVTVSDGSSQTLAHAEVKVTGTAPPQAKNTAPNIVQVLAKPPSGTTPLETEFSVAAKDTDGDPLFYVWDFGDGVVSGENPARHTYQKAGTYEVSVTVGDRNGGKTSERVTVKVTGGGTDTPDIPFYGRWVWALRKGSETAFTGYLDVSQKSLKSDSSLEEFFVRGGKGSWTYCEGGLDACGKPTGVGRVDVLDFGDDETFDIVFLSDKTGFEALTAYDEDDRIDNEDGKPTLRGEGVWYDDNGDSEDLDFTMVKVEDEPQKP